MVRLRARQRLCDGAFSGYAIAAVVEGSGVEKPAATSIVPQDMIDAALDDAVKRTTATRQQVLVTIAEAVHVERRFPRLPATWNALHAGAGAGLPDRLERGRPSASITTRACMADLCSARRRVQSRRSGVRRPHPEMPKGKLRADIACDASGHGRFKADANTRGAQRCFQTKRSRARSLTT
jgi:hypothetical protein